MTENRMERKEGQERHNSGAFGKRTVSIVCEGSAANFFPVSPTWAGMV
ncbi:MAG: hypothetical protein KDB79_13075 [Acidobacteria bacterium]|nr:hypothetical protein [Acidobacteriota bacterium]